MLNPSLNTLLKIRLLLTYCTVVNVTDKQISNRLQVNIKLVGAPTSDYVYTPMDAHPGDNNNYCITSIDGL